MNRRQPLLRVSGVAAPLLQDDVDTDQIIPSSYLKDMQADLAQGLLAYMRRDPEGRSKADFVLERPVFQRAPILLVGRNFGCGSSREHAVWAIKAFGIQCVIGHQLADFFRDNCVNNGVLPISLELPEWQALAQWTVASDGRAPLTVDLQACRIDGPGFAGCAFPIAPHARTVLLEGLDDIGLTQRHLDLVEAWERRTARQRPWMQSCAAIVAPALPEDAAR